MLENPYESPKIPADPVDNTYRMFDSSSCFAALVLCIVVAVTIATLIGFVAVW